MIAIEVPVSLPLVLFNREGWECQYLVVKGRSIHDSKQMESQVLRDCSVLELDGNELEFQLCCYLTVKLRANYNFISLFCEMKTLLSYKVLIKTK